MPPPHITDTKKKFIIFLIVAVGYLNTICHLITICEYIRNYYHTAYPVARKRCLG